MASPLTLPAQGPDLSKAETPESWESWIRGTVSTLTNPATSPQEALRLAADHPGEIDLLLTDVIMPDLNGPALVQRLLERRPQLKYLYMSGYTANLIASQGVAEDGLAFLPKPFSRNALAHKVREVLDG